MRYSTEINGDGQLSGIFILKSATPKFRDDGKLERVILELSDGRRDLKMHGLPDVWFTSILNGFDFESIRAGDEVFVKYEFVFDDLLVLVDIMTPMDAVMEEFEPKAKHGARLR